MIDLIARHRRRGILVDTNILLLAVIGSAGPQLIRRHKRTENFTSADYERLADLLELFTRIVTTPGILAEVSSLGRQIGDPSRTEVSSAFGRWLTFGRERLRERHVRSIEFASDPMLVRFGLTDAGIIRAARKGYLVLTDDLRLGHFLQSDGRDVINFNHLRF